MDFLREWEPRQCILQMWRSFSGIRPARLLLLALSRELQLAACDYDHSAQPQSLWCHVAGMQWLGSSYVLTVHRHEVLCVLTINAIHIVTLLSTFLTKYIPSINSVHLHYLLYERRCLLKGTKQRTMVRAKLMFLVFVVALWIGHVD